MCLCKKKLIYIKLIGRTDQPECLCSTVNSHMQSVQTLKGNYLATLMETADGDQHVQDDKHVCNWNFLLGQQTRSVQTTNTNYYHQQCTGTSNSWSYIGQAKEEENAF